MYKVYIRRKSCPDTRISELHIRQIHMGYDNFLLVSMNNVLKRFGYCAYVLQTCAIPVSSTSMR